MGDGIFFPNDGECEQKEASIFKLVGAASEKAGKLLAEHWQAVLEVADLLIQKKEMSGEEVAAIVNTARAVSNSNPPPQPAPHFAFPAPSWMY